MLLLLLVSMFTFTFRIQPVEASETIYVRFDGSVDPPSAPISSSDNITYTFTDNIYVGIEVQRSNVIVDGNGYILQGNNSNFGFLIGLYNVSIVNTNIRKWAIGIYSNGTIGCSITHNNFVSNDIGLGLIGLNSTIYHNNFINNTNQAFGGWSGNVWDDGYPSGGNYWSDYNGTDIYSGLHQNETGSDGIGDTNYIIGEFDRDRYPLMEPLPICPIAPMASFVFSPPPPTYVNETLVFDASLSYDPNGYISNYTWNFDDGTPILTTPNSTVTHTYTTEGTYNVTLTVTDEESLNDTTWEQIHVLPQTTPTLPDASFTWAPTRPKNNESTIFDASASTPNGGTIVKYQWNFSDDGNATGETTTHTFPTEGEYLVTLNVTKSDGSWNTEQKQIAINIPLSPDLSLSSPDVSFSDSNPSESQIITISATIHNIGEGDAENIRVRFYDDTNLIGEDIISSISHLSSGGASAKWAAGEEGFHLIKVVADPNNEIPETDEENNEATRSVLVGRLVGYGDIEVAGYLSQYETYSGSGVTVYGNVIYNTTYGGNTAVAGADVTIAIIGQTGQWETHTINTGDYSVGIVAPYSPGSYTVVITVTDYTFWESTQIELTVLERPEGHEEGVDLIFCWWCEISFAPPDPMENDYVTITANIRNIGTLDASNILVAFYHSDNLIGERTIDNISSGGIKSASLSWKASTSGWQNIGVEVDPENTILELNENNNFASERIYVYPAWADLTPTKISFSDTTPVANQLITVTAEVTNVGGINADNVLVRFYDNATFIGEQTIYSILGKGNTRETSIEHIFTAEGWHNITVVVDPDNTITEGDEDNNEIFEWICVHLPSMDLEISPRDILFSNISPMNGEVISIYAEVHNEGELEASNVTVKFLDDDILIDLTNITSILSQSYETTSVYWNATPPGWHRIMVIVDPDNMIDESNENNNIAVKWIRTYTPAEPPSDLFIYAEDVVFSNTHPDPAEEVIIYATVHNDGPAAAQNVSVAFSIDGTQIGFQTITSLSDGENTTLLEFWVAHEHENGSHVAKIVIDPGYNINDPNRANNTATRAIIVGNPPLSGPVASFSYSPYLPIVNEEVTFDASASYDPDPGGYIVSYEWNFGDNSTAEGVNATHAYSREESFTVTLTVTDSDEKTDITYRTFDVEAKKRLVILVHGFQLASFNLAEIWSAMKGELTQAGFDVFISNYTMYFPTLSDDYGIPGGYPLYNCGTPRHIWLYAIGLQTEILQKVKTGNYEKIYIVAHSMGGLVSRWCLEMLGMDRYVDKLIMLETPNHGFPLQLLGNPGLGWWIAYYVFADGAELPGWHSVGDMIWGSWFLCKLNRNYWNGQGYQYDASAYPPWDFWYPYNDVKSPKVHYEILVGQLYKSVVAPLFPLVQAVNTLLRPMFEFDQVDIPENNIFSDLGGASPAGFWDSHSLLRTDPKVIQRVIQILLDDPEPAEPNQLGELVQFAPTITDVISPGEHNKTHEIPISFTSEASVLLTWPEGDLNLTLIAPNGTIIDPNVAENDPNIIYYQEENITIRGYSIKNPEYGLWKANITAVNIPETQKYTISTFFDPNLTLLLELQNIRYDSNNNIHLRANLAYENETITDASVTATILKPDNTTEATILYDDGLHNDNQTNDGIYGNTYTNTSLLGTYSITVTANGSVNSQQFARETFAVVWVEQYPDLALNESDITFSNENPLAGENITISVDIHNVGEVDANNASILFYDGTPANGTLIGKDTINATAGITGNASVQWNGAHGTHEIYVLVSPWNEFLEENYTNNMAYKIIETSQQPVGGIYIPVNKLELLAPYIGLTILLAVAVVTVVYVMHACNRARRKGNLLQKAKELLLNELPSTTPTVEEKETKLTRVCWCWVQP